MPTDDRTTRLRASALYWMSDEGPLLVSLQAPNERARAAADTMMQICRGLADDGLCTEDVTAEHTSVFCITEKGRAHVDR